MFGLKTLFMYIIILGLVSGVGYLYYTDTQKRLKLAAERNATLSIAKEIQASTIQKINEDLERSQALVQELRDEFAGLRKDYTDLQKRFNKNSVNFGTRDIGKLAEVKPRLIEKIINKATKNVKRCLELAAGAPRTHDEIAARKKSQINTECPALANPNYVEAD